MSEPTSSRSHAIHVLGYIAIFILLAELVLVFGLPALGIATIVTSGLFHSTALIGIALMAVLLIGAAVIPATSLLLFIAALCIGILLLIVFFPILIGLIAGIFGFALGASVIFLVLTILLMPLILVGLAIYGLTQIGRRKNS